MARRTLFQTPEQAVATLGLLLRSTGNFSIKPYSVTTRGTYLWLALDSLIPHYGLWAVLAPWTVWPAPAASTT